MIGNLWIFLIDNMWVLRKEQLLDQQPSKYEHVANFVFNWRFLLQPSTWYTLLYLVNVIMQYHIPAHLNNISHLKCYFLNRNAFMERKHIYCFTWITLMSLHIRYLHEQIYVKHADVIFIEVDLRASLFYVHYFTYCFTWFHLIFIEVGHICSTLL